MIYHHTSLHFVLKQSISLSGLLFFSMQSILQSLNNENPTQCPVCNKHLKTTQGLSAHLRTAKHCSWYKMGKLSELRVSRSLVEDPIETGEEETELPVGPGQSHHQEQEPSQVVEDFVNHAFDLVPLEADDTAPGPSHQGRNSGYSQPDDFVDERIEEDPFPTAAKVV